jgi:hypothetical protein
MSFWLSIEYPCQGDYRLVYCGDSNFSHKSMKQTPKVRAGYNLWSCLHLHSKPSDCCHVESDTTSCSHFVYAR